jgi:hypothetical protein
MKDQRGKQMNIIEAGHAKAVEFIGVFKPSVEGLNALNEAAGKAADLRMRFIDVPQAAWWIIDHAAMALEAEQSE